MYSSIYSYPWDVQDETPARFCATMREELGVDTVSLAVSYHAAKLLLPHNPRRRVYFPEDGSIFFQPDPQTYVNSKIKPHVSALARETDVLAALCTEAERAGLGVIAWTVCLHNTRLGMEYSEYAPRNAFGDPALTYLCPSQPAARAYIAALASDLARYPLKAIQLEAAHHMSFVHGYHHEMQQVVVTPTLQVLLGLCFCDACMHMANEKSIDGERVRQFVRAEIEQQLQTETDTDGETAWEWEHWQSQLDGELARYFALRGESVKLLLSEVYQAVHAGSSVAVHLQDPSSAGAQSLTALERNWQTGIEIPTEAGTADGVTMLGYIPDLPTFQREVDIYRDVVLPYMPVEVGMRPALPDCTTQENLAAKVAYCAQNGMTGVSFYNYGMLPKARFRWIKEALASVQQ